MLQEAKEQFEQIGEKLGAAQCLQSLANICRMLGQYDQAKSMLQEAKGQYEQIGEKLGAADVGIPDITI
jgi:tetratricopeptide (TPR) repeat protein